MILAALRESMILRPLVECRKEKLDNFLFQPQMTLQTYENTGLAEAGKKI